MEQAARQKFKIVSKEHLRRMSFLLTGPGQHPTDNLQRTPSKIICRDQCPDADTPCDGSSAQHGRIFSEEMVGD